MTVTEHWWAESPNRDNYARLWSEAEAASYRRAGWDVDGPYVDAADHRGAVARIAELEAEVAGLAAELRYAQGQEDEDLRDEHGGLGFGGQ